MAHNIASAKLTAALAVGLIAALGLSACGRAGAPLPPPAAAPLPTAAAGGSAAPTSAHQVAVTNGFDAQGNPVAPPGEKKSFLLDPLLGPIVPPASGASAPPSR